MDERAIYAAVAGQVIQQLRTGQSQASLAARAELSTSALSRFEHGQSLPDMYEIRRLARALGREPGEFMELVEQAVVRTRQVAQQVSAGDPWDGIAAAALAALAVIAIVAILAEAEKKNRKKTGRKA